MKLLEKETTKFIILLIIIFIEIIVIHYKSHNCSRTSTTRCTAAFNCKVDEKNPQNMICNYFDAEGEPLNEKITCPNTLCDDAYSCLENKDNKKVMDCKYSYDGEERDVKCPNNEVINHE